MGPKPGHRSPAWAPRSLVLQHEAAAPSGLIADWLLEQSAQVDTLRVDKVDPIVDPRDYDLIVMLGSELAAYDDSIPFLAPEMRTLAAALEADVPILGLCFGGQLLARVLGAHVFRLEHPEIGWMRVRTYDPELMSEGPWFQWHYDGFALPPGARLVAETEVGVQAFASGRSLGLQCHPEVTPEIVADWALLSSNQTAEDWLASKALIDETRRREAGSKRATWRLLDRFRDKVVGAKTRRRRGRRL